MVENKWWRCWTLIWVSLTLAAAHNGGLKISNISQVSASASELMANDSDTDAAWWMTPSELGDAEEVKQAVLTEPGLHEINGTALNLLLEDVRGKEDSYLGVFCYARWCPFSQQLLPLIRTLPELFPQLPLVAVEERAVKPSALSKYGVYSFPLFFVYSKNHRSKFTGPRKLETLVEMITAATDYNPVARPSPNFCEANLTLFDTLSLPGRIAGSQVCPDLRTYRQRAVPEESCPYRWTFQPSIWASNDLYLTLATVFLALRSFSYVVQKGWTWMKQRQTMDHQTM